MTEEAAYYRLAPGTDVVRLADGTVLLRSDLVALRLDGASASMLADDILPLLDGTRSLAEVCDAVPHVSLDDLREHLDTLALKGVLRRDGRAATVSDGEPSAMAPLVHLLEALGSPTERRQALSTSRVAILGLEAHGAHAAAVLAASGVGRVVLADPYPLEVANLGLAPGLNRHAVGAPRQEAMRASLADQGLSGAVVAHEGELTPESIDALAAGCDLLIGCFDRAFSAVNHWINAAGLAHGVPALYGELHGTSAFVGPLTVPGETACYLCWRMRAIACEEDFEAAMGYEEFLDHQRRPALHERAVLPGLPLYVGGMLALETLKHLLGLGPGALVGRVHEFDAVANRGELHTVLAVADCPACKKKKTTSSPPPAPATDLARPAAG